MKRILITGADSYIGISFENYLKQQSDEYTVDTIDMRNEEWRKKNFSKYDTIFHVAGIAHIKQTTKNEHVYYEVNRDLPIEVATKAKEDGVEQFIFMSSMSVYGMETGFITNETTPAPKTAYGISKLEADIEIGNMQSDYFRVAILRPPMIYGNGCKGNYQTLKKYALRLPCFPNINNERSMCHIHNLAIFVKSVIDNKLSGIFFPQDSEYVNTAHMVKLVAERNGKKVKLTRIFNPFIKLGLSMHVHLFEKVFGSLTYEKIDVCSPITFSEFMAETEIQ